MEQLAAAATAQGSDFMGGGGHPLAGGPASRTEHGERTARLPARALNPCVHPAGAAVPPAEARCLFLTAAPDPGRRPEGDCAFQV